VLGLRRLRTRAGGHADRAEGRRVIVVTDSARRRRGEATKVHSRARAACDFAFIPPRIALFSLVSLTKPQGEPVNVERCQILVEQMKASDLAKAALAAGDLDGASAWIVFADELNRQYEALLQAAIDGRHA
jgi:hypothetical protein